MRYELRKILHHRYFFIVIAVIFLANGFGYCQYARTQEVGYDQIQMRQIYNENTPESLRALETELRDRLYGDESIDVPELVTGNVYNEWNLVNAALERIQATEHYSQHIDQLIQEATVKIGSGAFGGMDSYSVKALQRTIETYQSFQGRDLPILFTGGYVRLTEFPLTDFLIVLLGCMAVFVLISEERSNGTLCLIKPTKHGNHRLYFNKYVSVVMVVLAGTVALYGSNLGLTAWIFGLDGLSAPVQSINELSNCSFDITIKEYLLFYYALKILWCLAVTSLFWTLNCLTSQRGVTFLLTFGMCLIAIITAGQSNLWIKALNPICQMETNRLIGSLTVLNCFGEPVSALTAVTFELAFLIFGNYVIGHLCFIKTAAIPKTRKAGSMTWPFVRHTVHLRHEGFKLNVLQGGALVLCCLLLLQCIQYRNFSANNNEWEFYYRSYSSVLSGAPDEEKNAFLTEEKAKFEELQERINTYAAICGDDLEKFELLTQNLQQQMMAWEPFQYALEQYTALKGDEVYIYQTGYEYLFGSWGKNDDAQNTIKFLAALILGLAGIFSIEEETGMIVLIMSGRERKRVARSKRTIAMLYMIFAMVIAYLPQYIAIHNAYGLSYLSAPASSIGLMEGYPMWCDIWMVIAVTWILRLLIGAAASELIMLLSKKTKSTVLSVATGACLLAVTAILVTL